ncbi:amidase [Pseudomonas benzenivorans]|uniref:Amidase n=1 Tax=Pseudomonas benzenivorans TaxID=556533 RepID=A0ABY5H229_9PSED|nr:amidase [Pseudomonas benzenivorans]UTW06084.1 amidase [Pseudomonas benzenivorans]
MSSDVLPVTLTGLRKALAAGQFTVDEALQAQVAHLRLNAAKFRCVTTIHDRPDPGRRRATDSAGHGAGPQRLLEGVGLAHKDIFHRVDRPATCGHKQPPPVSRRALSAAALTRLDAAGASELASLCMAEYACGATGQSEQADEPVNPLDQAAAVGGSSSGSAVAVAAGLCYASLGTDTAGSVRIPAATCGVLGLKPTRGLIPSSGVFPLAPSLDTVGVIARSAADAAHLLAVTATRGLRGLRDALGSPERLEDALLASPSPRLRYCFDATPVREDVLGVLHEFIQHLPATWQATPRAAPWLKELTGYAETLLHVEAAQVHLPRLKQPPADLGPMVRAIALPGIAMPAVWYAEALASRAQWAKRLVAEYFQAADILLMPALPDGVPNWDEVHTQSPRFNGRALASLYRLMPFVNYLGFPSIVFPVGTDAFGRPVSVQAIGRPFSETSLLAFAYRVERDLFGANGFAPLPLTHDGSSTRISIKR